MFANTLALLANLKIKDHPPELEREEIEKWVDGFSKKIKRKTTRTQKCRLIAAVERMTFREDGYVCWWQYCEFDGEKGTIFWGDQFNRRKLEDFELSEIQKQVLLSEPNFLNEKISRWEIKEEKGKWELTEEIEKKVISEGGEALVFSEQFGKLETAVRVQVFDPFLFTDQFGHDSVVFKINLAKGKNRSFNLQNFCFEIFRF